MSRAAPVHLSISTSREHFLILGRSRLVIFTDEVRRRYIFVRSARKFSFLHVVGLENKSRLPERRLGLWEIVVEDRGAIENAETAVWLSRKNRRQNACE